MRREIVLVVESDRVFARRRSIRLNGCRARSGRREVFQSCFTDVYSVLCCQFLMMISKQFKKAWWES